MALIIYEKVGSTLSIILGGCIMKVKFFFVLILLVSFLFVACAAPVNKSCTCYCDKGDLMQKCGERFSGHGNFGTQAKCEKEIERRSDCN